MALDDVASAAAPPTAKQPQPQPQSNGGKRRQQKPPLRFANQLLQPEYLEEVPHDLETSWIAVPYVPEGRRVLAVVQRHRSHGGETRMTLYSRKRGEPINPAFVREHKRRRRKPYKASADPPPPRTPRAQRDFSFPVHLPIPPGTMLDCVFAPASCALYALDLLQWGDRDYRECDVEFRTYWLEAKLSEALMERTGAYTQTSSRSDPCCGCSGSAGWPVPYGSTLPLPSQADDGQARPEPEPIRLDGPFSYPFIVLPLRKVSPPISTARWLSELIAPTLEGEAADTATATAHLFAPAKLCIEVAVPSSAKTGTEEPQAKSYTMQHLPAFLAPPRQDGLLLYHRDSTYQALGSQVSAETRQAQVGARPASTEGMELDATAGEADEDQEDGTTPLACWIPVRPPAPEPVAATAPRGPAQPKTAGSEVRKVAGQSASAPVGDEDDDAMQGGGPAPGTVDLVDVDEEQAATVVTVEKFAQ